MTANIDFAAYEAELRRSTEEVRLEAEADPNADPELVKAQSMFDETMIQFGLAVAKLAASDFSGKAITVSIGSALGGMYGDIHSTMIAKGHIADARALNEAFKYAHEQTMRYRLTGEVKDGNAIGASRAASDFERKDG